MSHQKISHHTADIQRQHDDWDEVHSQLLVVQKKSLQISDPQDADEKEADAVAQKVVEGGSAEINGAGSTINRKGEGSAETTPGFQAKLESSKGNGYSLDDSLRNEMETKMNADFSGVKIHTGNEVHGMNESINAKAFTHGQDIFFRDGQFDTGSKQGKELLAHELVHTKQQQPDKISRKILVNGVTASAASLLPQITTDVTAWYPAIIAGVQAKVTGFTASDMPFDLAGAIATAGMILNEMEDAKYAKATEVQDKKSKSRMTGAAQTVTKYSREQYDFDFGTQQDASDEVIFRLALIVNMHLANLDKTKFARYPGDNDPGFNLQNTDVWGTVQTYPIGNPGGFTLKPGTLPATAIIQLTTPPKNAKDRIVIDCSTMMGILLYESLVGTTPTEQSAFNTQFQNNLFVGQLNSLHGDKNENKHPLVGTANPANSPYMKPVTISRLDDLVPGDVISFANYPKYGQLEPSGLWNGEWATYTKKQDGVMYFEGFGVNEDTYDNFIIDMQDAYDSAWDNSNSYDKGPKLKTQKTEDTIEKKFPGISKKVLRIDLNAYSQT